MRERILKGVGLLAAVSISAAPGVETRDSFTKISPHIATIPAEIEISSRLPEGIKIGRDRNPKKIPCYTPPSLRRHT